jgi:hypothetical protein
MLFNSNDISLGNYEEFFILYMDNELTNDQRKMVEVFLQANRDLQAELEILMSIKLPAEAFSFDKEALLAESMEMNAIGEDLLLYIDDELVTEKKKIVELELASNKSYQQQHQHLLQTKLDASEVVAYPNKKELYRRTEKIVAFKPWMRIAAAVLVIAAMSVLYFAANNTPTVVQPVTAEVEKPLPLNTEPVQSQINTIKETSEELAIAENSSSKQNVVAQTQKEKTESNNDVKYVAQQVNDIIANNITEDVVSTPPLAKSTTTIAGNSSIEATTASFDPYKGTINTSNVTSALSQRNTITNATESTVPGNDVANNSERKGSFKSFLRKATRLIERKTGIDPTNGDDDELLIGAVAVKLK